MKAILLNILILHCLVLSAQNLGIRYESCANCETHNSIQFRPSYESQANMTTNFVTSDYGRRDNPGGTEWHKGIDLSPEDGDKDLGDHILAIEPGTIRLLGGINAYKYIAIQGAHNFGYAHIFRDATPTGSNYQQLGDLFLKRMDFPNGERFAIIHYPSDIATPGAATAISDVPGTVTLDGYTINVRNTINSANEVIAPLGDAQGGYAHLHLHKFTNIFTFTSSRNNTKNPLEVVDHQVPDYRVTIDDLVERYGVTPSSIKVRVEMLNDPDDNTGTYDNGVMNVDQVMLEIQELGGQFEQIRGAEYNSRMDMGGRAGTVIYPPWTPTPTNDDFTDLDGSASVFGVNPFAYSTTNEPNAGEPYDDYYFSDFVTRIADSDQAGGTVNLASRNELARYKDGLYNVRASMTTVRGNTEPYQFGTFTLDNFRPYVKSVTILRNDKEGSTLYFGDFNSNTLQIDGFDVNNINETDILHLIVEFSESMMPGTVSAYVDSNVNGSRFLEHSVDQKTFEFRLDPLGSSEINKLQKLIISAEDLAGNELQTDLSTFISYKTGTSTWSTTLTPGSDENYIFNGDASACEGNFDPLQSNSEYTLQSASTGECIYVAFEVDKQNPAAYEPVVFSPVGSEDPSLTYNWDFDYSDDPSHVSSAVPATSTDRDVTVMYETEGPKTIRLEICSGGNCTTNEMVGFMDVGAANAPLDVDFNVVGSSNRGTNEDIYFTSTVSNNTGLLSYSWDFGFGSITSNSDQASPQVNYFSIGSKKISLTVSDGLQTVTKTKGDYLTISRTGSDPINVTLSCPPNGGRYLELDAFDGLSNNASDGIVGNEQILWEFEDGQISSSRDLWVEFKSPGLYEIKLTICDDSGCSTDICQYRALDEYYSTGNYNFTINGQLAGQYSGGSYETTPIQNIAANFPLILNDATGKVTSSNIKYYIYKGNAENPFLTIDDGPGPHEVFLPDPNSWYSIYYQVGMPGQNFVPFAYIYADENSQITERCIARFGSTVLGETCWNDSNLPQFTVDLESNGCPIGLVELIDHQSGQVLTTNTTNYLWPLSKKPTSFPYSTTIEARAYYDCGSGNDCTLLSTKEFDLTIYSFDNISINTTYQSCVGASTQIGPEPNDTYSYLWSSVDGDSDINFLSDITVSNPSFVAYQPSGASPYRYDLTITDNFSGCSSTERISINTTGIETQSYAQTVTAGSQAELQSPVVGGGADYEYEWSPATYLDNSKVPNPIITAPNVSGSIDYTVSVSFRGSCFPTTDPIVSLTFENPPPKNLSIRNDGTPFPVLEWQHDGVAQSYRIRKSTDGGSFSTIATVNGETFTYQDITSCDDPAGTNYCYKIVGVDMNGATIAGSSNTECTDFTGVGESYTSTVTLPHHSGTLTLFPPDVSGLNSADFDYQWSPATFLDDPGKERPVMTIPNYGTTVNYTVDISYQGMCTATATATIVVDNPGPSGFSVGTFGQYPNSQFPSIEWQENGVVNYSILKRSVNGGPYEEVIRGSDFMDHIDFECIYSTVEYCYILEAYDYQDELIGTAGPSCVTVPYVASLTSDFSHTSSYYTIAKNKSEVFNGFGGNTLIPIENLGEAAIGLIDAAVGRGTPVFHMDFRDGNLDRVGPMVVGSGDFDFWPTAMAETNNYIFIVGAADESGYPAGILNVIRYRKTDGVTVRKRVQNKNGNYMQLTAPALINKLGGDDFVIACSYSGSSTSVWTIMKPTNFLYNQWIYESYGHSSYDAYISDLEVFNDVVYITSKQRVTSNGNEHFRNIGFEIRVNPPYPDRFDQEYYSADGSQASVPIHPKTIFHNNNMYAVSEMGTNQIYIKHLTPQLSRNWDKSFALTRDDFEIKALEIFNDEVFAVSQNGTSILIVTFDLNGNKTSERYFEMDGIDKVLGAAKVADKVVINYTKDVVDGVGDVHSSVFGGGRLEIAGDKRLCWWEFSGDESLTAENFDVADGCDFYVNDGQSLELNATGRITLHPGFSATAGSNVHLRTSTYTPVEDCPPIDGARTSGVASSLEVEILEGEDVNSDTRIYAYPNPSRDWVNIAYVLDENVDIKVSLFNIEGKQVATYNYKNTNYINDRIHVGELAKGIYIVKIESKSETREIRISVK